jgi:hypothetical protein
VADGEDGDGAGEDRLSANRLSGTVGRL